MVKMKMRIPATKESMNQILSMVSGDMEKTHCQTKQIYKMEIAIEELFVNIVNYAYPDADGDIEVLYDLSDQGDTVQLDLTLMDTGIPYNPLEEKEPDITLGAEERKAGGLGIFLAKKFMDSISYEYKEGYNCLSVSKKVEKMCEKKQEDLSE